MFGDVFGNRLADGVPADGGDTTPRSGSVISWQPLVEQIAAPSSQKKYGYDPWTKTAFRVDRGLRWWCWAPRSIVWHASLNYTIGSVLFVAASACALLVHVRAVPVLSRWLFVYPYALGSLMYTVGASLLLGVSWYNHPSRVYGPPEPQQVWQGTPEVRPSAEEHTGTFQNLSHPPSMSSTFIFGDPGEAILASDADAAYVSEDALPSTLTQITSQPLPELEPLPAAASHLNVITRPGAVVRFDSSRGSTGPPAAAGAAPVAAPPQGTPTSGVSRGGVSRSRSPSPAGSPSKANGQMSSPADTASVRSRDGSYQDTGPSPGYFRLFMNRWRTTSTAENINHALLGYQHRERGQVDALLRSYYTRSAYYHIHADPWYRTRWLLDLGGSLAIWVGALLYNVSCFSDAYKAVAGELPPIVADAVIREQLLLYWPDVFGGALFVLGSWLFWWSAHETPWLSVPNRNTLVWYLTVSNLGGSIGFFIGAAFQMPIAAVPFLVPNWVELLVGYVIGSALFLVGSYLMIVEIAASK